jgi:hypothetical protein
MACWLSFAHLAADLLDHSFLGATLRCGHVPRTLKRSSIELELNHLHRPPLPMARQRFQQCLGVLHVRGVEALGEPIIDWGQQLVRIDTLALLLPEPTQAHYRPQLERLGLQRLRAQFFGQGQGLLVVGFGRRDVGGAACAWTTLSW